jgi:opacity protein-like surface antigen
MVRNLIYAGAAVAALLMGSAAPANASEIVADPSTVSASSGAGSQVRTSAIQGDVRVSGTQGEVHDTIKAVPGVKAHAMPTPNTCDGELNYTCDD